MVLDTIIVTVIVIVIIIAAAGGRPESERGATQLDPTPNNQINQTIIAVSKLSVCI